MVKKWSKMVQTGPNGPKWSKMVKEKVKKWSKMVTNGQNGKNG